MAYGELYEIPKCVIEHYNPVNGRFVKGHIPATKGKRWSDYMGKRAQRRCMKGWKNIIERRPKIRSEKAGRPKKQVVAVFPDGSWKVFSYLGSAHAYFGGNKENISRCCRMNNLHRLNKKTSKINTDHKYNGIRFYFESDNTWLEKIK